MGGAIGLGAQKSPLLAAAPDEAQAIAVGILHIVLCQPQQAHGAGHIVVSALRKRGGIIVGGEHNILLRLAGHIQHHILGGVGVFLLLQGDLRCFGTLLDHCNGILGVDVDAGDHIALAHIAAKLPGVDIPVGIVGVAVVGDEARRAVGQNVLVHPVAQIAVDHHDLAPALAQRPSILVAQIIKRGLQLCVTGAHIALAGNILPINGEGRLFNVPQGHLKGLLRRLQAPRGKALT